MIVTKNKKETLTFDEMRNLQIEYDKNNNQNEISIEEINQYIKEVRDSDTSKPKQKRL